MTAALATGRLLGPAGSDLAAHLATHGPLPAADRFALEVNASGLTGRGGAAFPTGRKLDAVRAAAGRPIVVGNGAEGEPASDKDRQLLYRNPHLVVDGLQKTAAPLGADEAYLYVRPDPSLHRALTAVLAERSRAGLDPCPVRLVRAADGFLAGQETALIRHLSGGPALPTYAPVRVSVRGLRGRPTSVHNVESLAQAALIGRYGAAWFRSAGTAAEPGTMLATVWPADRPGFVAEYDAGTPIVDILGPGTGSAVLTGGYHGTWLPAPLARELTFSTAQLRPYGGSVGAGVIAELPAWCCGVRETARVLRYLALESAAQCGPCLNGLPRIAGALTALADGRVGAGALGDLHRWCGMVARRGACAHPDGSIRLVRSALTTFEPEVRLHLDGRCSAGSTAGFLPLPPEEAR